MRSTRSTKPRYVMSLTRASLGIRGSFVRALSLTRQTFKKPRESPLMASTEIIAGLLKIREFGPSIYGATT
jgi:hypothetical protein